jgi:hypothetical protein
VEYFNVFNCNQSSTLNISPALQAVMTRYLPLAKDGARLAEIYFQVSIVRAKLTLRLSAGLQSPFNPILGRTNSLTTSTTIHNHQILRTSPFYSLSSPWAA